MAPVNKMRTYGRPNSSIVNNSVDAFNALFAKNMTKRLIGKKKKKKILVRELPSRSKCNTLLGYDSLQISTEDTFDKLVKGALSKPTKQDKNVSDTSIKRLNALKTRSYIKETTTYHSPIMTRSRSNNMSYKSDPFFTRMHEPTVDGINSADYSIEIDKGVKKEINCVSNIPELRVFDTPRKENITESCIGNIFTKTFRERQMIHCSTPVGAVAKKRIINHTLSPISNLTTSGLKSLVEESVKEIKKWDFRVPDLIEVNNTNCDSRDINIEESTRNELRGKISQSLKEKINNSNRRDSYITLRKRKIPRRKNILNYTDSSCIEKSLTVSLEDFNTFETRSNRRETSVNTTSHKSYSLNDFEKFVKQTLDVTENFVTKRRRRFTDDNVINSNCIVLLSKIRDTEIQNTESAMEPKSKKDNNAFQEKELYINLKKLSFRTTSLSSALSNFETFYRSNIKENINISEDVYLPEDSSNKNMTQEISKDVNTFESFYEQNYKISMERDNVNNAIVPQNLCVNLTKNYYSSSKENLNDLVPQDSVIVPYSSSKYSEEIKNDTANNFVLHNLVQIPKNNFCDVDANMGEFSKDLLSEDLKTLIKCSTCSSPVDINNLSRSSGFVLENNEKLSNRSTENKNCNSPLSIIVSSSNDCDLKSKSDLTMKVEEDNVNADTVDTGNYYENSSKCLDLAFDLALNYFEPKIDANNIDCIDYSQRNKDSIKLDELNKSPNIKYVEDFIELKDKNNISGLTSTKNSIIDLTDTPEQDIKKKLESFIKTPSKEDSQKILYQSDSEKYNSVQRKLFNTDSDRFNQIDLQGDHHVDNSIENNTDVINLSLTKKNVPSAEEICQGNYSASVLEESCNQNISSDIIESSLLDSTKIDGDGFRIPILANKKNKSSKSMLLRPGKLWRRSLSIIKRSSVMLDMMKEISCSAHNGDYCECSKCSLSRSSICLSKKRLSIRIVPANPSPVDSNRKISILEHYALNNSYVQEADQVELLQGNLEENLRCLSLSKQRRNSILENRPVTAREVVLRRCGQTEPILFQTCYTESILQNCQKIGEGVYGEVYLFKNPNGGTSVMKVIPIEGDLLVNGERQKKFEEILSEIIIAMELSNLRHNKKNVTSCFSEVQKIQCVQGCYPQRLLDLWDLYDETRGSENDCPDIFGEDQLYIVLQLANAGKDLEAYIFNNALQAFSMFKQVAFAMAVAEEDLRFEHRDLHWGNVLLNTVERNKKVKFCLDNETYELQTKGVEAAIIDFTLSRIEYEGVVIYNDLSLDPELFTAEGDYQFEVYRLMQKKNRNNWQIFEPYSNLLWLNYILDKAITALRYKNVQTKTHKEYINKFKQVKHDVLNYKSVKDFVLNCLL